MRRWSFAKGHGTHNDFVVLLDRESMLEVGPSEVRFICDRRGGIGADGLLRAVLAKHIDGWTGDGALWFMDYRNADGSIAEMCGNGLRVFVRFLLDQGLVNGPARPDRYAEWPQGGDVAAGRQNPRVHGLGRDRQLDWSSSVRPTEPNSRP